MKLNMKLYAVGVFKQEHDKKPYTILSSGIYKTPAIYFKESSARSMVTKANNRCIDSRYFCKVIEITI